MWKLVLVRLETVLVSMQDRCMVCTERTTGSKHQMELLGDVCQVESHFGLFGDSVSVGAMPDLHQTYHRL
jgi:hypothetical protein